MSDWAEHARIVRAASDLATRYPALYSGLQRDSYKIEIVDNTVRVTFRHYHGTGLSGHTDVTFVRQTDGAYVPWIY
jgi:hypothetical protein